MSYVSICKEIFAFFFKCVLKDNLSCITYCGITYCGITYCGITGNALWQIHLDVKQHSGVELFGPAMMEPPTVPLTARCYTCHDGIEEYFYYQC